MSAPASTSPINTVPLPASEQMSAMYLSMPRVMVASLYPLPIRYERPFKSTVGGGFHTAYTLDAAPVDSSVPVLLRANGELGIGVGLIHQHMGNRRYGTVPEEKGALGIALDFIRYARNVPGSNGVCHPAVWICRDASGPDKEEIRLNLRAQENLARSRVIKSDDNWIKGERQHITEFDRVLASWLRVDIKAHPWMQNDERAELKKCQFCRTDIDAQAAVCPQCSKVVDARLYRDLEAMQAAALREAADLAEQEEKLREEMKTAGIEVVEPESAEAANQESAPTRPAPGRPAAPPRR